MQLTLGNTYRAWDLVEKLSGIVFLRISRALCDRLIFRNCMQLITQCICGRRFTNKRGMKIHRTKTRCLNALAIQKQCTAQADQTSRNQSQVQNHSAGEIHADESDKEFPQPNNTKRQRINFPPAWGEDQRESLDTSLVLPLDKLIGKNSSTSFSLSTKSPTKHV